MASPENYATSQKSVHGQNRLQEYWERVTEGLQVSQLWGQMKADARSTYSFYAHDVDWELINKGKRWKRVFRIAWGFFQAMLMKLTPARRVLLLVACVLLIVHLQFGAGSRGVCIRSRRNRNGPDIPAACFGACRSRDHEARSGNRARDSALAGP